MKKIQIVRITCWWGQRKLIEKTEQAANSLELQGCEIVSISFYQGYAAYITFRG